MTSKESLNILIKRMLSKHDYDQLSFIRDDPGRELFYDQFSGTFFKSSKEAILAAECILNRELILNGVVNVDEFYKIVGMHSKYIENRPYGWNKKDINWIEFDHILVDAEFTQEIPYHLIVMIPQPYEMYLKGVMK